MNIMIFADQESKLLYEYYAPERMKDIDLIISCGCPFIVCKGKS